MTDSSFFAPALKGDKGDPGLNILPAWLSIYDTTNQYQTLINTAKSITYNNIGTLGDIFLGVDGSSITFTDAGVYNIQFSAQLASENNNASFESQIYIWAKLNNVDIVESAGTITLNGKKPRVISSWNYVLEIPADGTFQLYWSTTNIESYLKSNSSVAPAPNIPSLIVTATRVA
jgi:hypothetical protein